MMRKILLIMMYMSLAVFAQNGLVQNYYSDGKLESEINYLNGIREGEAKFYKPDGTLKEECLYINGRIDGIVRVYGDSNVVREVISLEYGKRNGPVSLYDENGVYQKDVYYEEGKKVVTPEPVTQPEEKPVFVYKEPEKDKDKKQKTKSETEMSLPPVIEEKNYSEDPSYYTSESVEVMPEPIGGMQNIQRRVYYPLEARRKKVEGVVKVMAYIDEYGVVQKSEVVEKLGYGCDDAAQITVYYTKFKPGVLKGRPVKTQIVIPVEFKLPN